MQETSTRVSLMSLLSRIKVESINENSTAHKVYINGIEQHNISNLCIEYSPYSAPSAVITYNAASDIDEFAKIQGIFDTDSIREAIKFLSLQLQFDEDLRDAWIYSIESALIESREKDVTNTHEIATAVLERLIE